ncbi:hypothetical protein T439DRAFT_328663 [Meredithblackwellia eburnea MCA 4105]
MLRRQKDKLTVKLDEDTIFLHPGQLPHTTHQAPRDDPILKGHLTLSLRAPRRITRIQVELKGIVTTGHGEYKYETGNTISKTLEIEVGERLAAGDHQYIFSFIIPSSTAVQERSKYGTVRHTVRATCDGLGSFGGTLSSLFVPVWLIANPSPPGELPQGVEVTVQDLGADIGPVALHVSSAHLTVASLLFMNITLMAPPALQIFSVTAFVAQQFQITYDDPTIGTVTPAAQRKLLFYADQTTPADPSATLLDRSNIGRGASLPSAFESRKLNPKPLVELSEGKEWNYSRIVRLLDDDHLRPTTLEGTETKVRVKHRLVVEMRYRKPGSKKDMVLEMSTELTIASCCCLIDSLLLPSYASSAPKATPIRPFHRRCLCNSTLSEMVAKEGQELSRASTRFTLGRHRQQQQHLQQQQQIAHVPKLGLPAGERYLNERYYHHHHHHHFHHHGVRHRSTGPLAVSGGRLARRRTSQGSLNSITSMGSMGMSPAVSSLTAGLRGPVPPTPTAATDALVEEIELDGLDVDADVEGEIERELESQREAVTWDEITEISPVVGVAAL